AADELGDQRVILGQLLQLAVADQIGARVADVADRDAAVLDERDRHRRAHAGGGGVLRLALVDPPVGLLNQVVDPLLAARQLAGLVAQRRGCQARGELARLGAAHAVGDSEQRRLADVGVLVVPPPPAGVRDAGRLAEPGHASYLSSVSPTRTMSPGVSRLARESLIPFR